MTSWADMCNFCRSQFVLVCVIMLGLLTLIVLLDYYKMQKKKRLIRTIAGLLIAMGVAVIGLEIPEYTTFLGEITDWGSFYAVIIITIVALAILVFSVLTIVIMESIRKISTKKTLYSIFFSMIGLMSAILIAAVIMITFIPAFKLGDNVHIGSIIGFPALFLLSIGTIIVVFDEPKLVMYHGLTAGGSWILTVMNVLALFALTEVEMTDFSGVIHTFHILCGGIGLISGFLSALFGISGQRKFAKLTGYITLGCWWTAYLVSTFITGV